jgi:uncharacterized protein with von Willebrand factor type A (vWA) domain
VSHDEGASPRQERASALDRPYERLAALPRTLWRGALVTGAGERTRRLDDTRRWREALLDHGMLPAPDADFGDAAASAPLRRVVAELGLSALARGVPALADQVLRTLLWHLDQIADLQPRRTRAEAIADVATWFRSAWQLEAHGLEPELALWRDLGLGAHLQWDQLRGRLRSREWQAARRAADRLAALPEIAALLQRLGRRELAKRDAPSPAPEASARERMPWRAHTTRLVGAPGEIEGIRFDSRLEHMLPSEALLLRHPVGQRLWRARQAEGRLLAHQTSALVTDWRPAPAGTPRGAAPHHAPKARERGPIVLCLDTSGSMAGAPEQIAKAVTIAALQAAHREGRACRLIAFGGPGEVVEHELSAGAAGLAATLELMGQAFDGGTDVQTPIERAVQRVHEDGWQDADLLIASDGEFGCVRATLDALDAARRGLGLFVQGILVGDRETMGLLEVCDDIFWVRDWRRHGDDPAAARAPSPVHSKSLTALYFPNALSAQAARHRPRAG